MIKEIFEIISDTLTSKVNTIRIGNKEKDTEYVKNWLRRLK